MEIKIYLLQRPHIEIDGKEAFTKLNNKAFAMVLYLASKQGQAVSKEVLSEIFWPQQQEENARSNLRHPTSKKSARRNLPTFVRKRCPSYPQSETSAPSTKIWISRWT